MEFYGNFGHPWNHLEGLSDVYFSFQDSSLSVIRIIINIRIKKYLPSASLVNLTYGTDLLIRLGLNLASLPAINHNLIFRFYHSEKMNIQYNWQ